MAFSAMFLLIFLLFHLTSNLISVFSPEAFNEASHFLGYNFVIQKIMQPILGFGVVFHFVMGFILEIRNRAARPVNYAINNPSANSTWFSRNMIVTGLVILAFLGLHLYDFWFHEMTYKYFPGNGNPDDISRYWMEMHEKFANPVRVGIYVISFILLGMHLAHGFQSSFQSIGARHPKYTPVIKAIGTFYAIFIPLGFIVVAVFHFVTQQ